LISAFSFQLSVFDCPGALQEADETQLWLELLADDCGVRNKSLEALHHEAGELMAIFVTMVNRTQTKSRKLKTES
jgi:hypothetical protein